MLKPSEVLMRAHNEGRKCGRCYTSTREDVFTGMVWCNLCALGFLIEPFKDEFDIEDYDPSEFVAEKYNIPFAIADEIENRYEGWGEYEKQQPLNVIAEWLESIGY